MEIEQIHLVKSGLTDNVYIGTIAKDGVSWLEKKDITNEFITAVIQRWSGYTQTLTDTKGKKYKVSVRVMVETGKRVGGIDDTYCAFIDRIPFELLKSWADMLGVDYEEPPIDDMYPDWADGLRTELLRAMPVNS